MRAASSSVLASLAGALLLPNLAHAEEADRHPSLGAPATVEVRDAREADQRGDSNLGWYESDAGDLAARGPGAGFSLVSEVLSTILEAGDTLGVALYPGAKGSEPLHLSIEVDDFWCEDTLSWEVCHATLRGALSGPQATGEWFELEHETDGGYRELRPGLRDQLLVELARAQADSGLGQPVSDDRAHPVMRFGWLEQLDGNRSVGRIGQGTEDICVQERNGGTRRVPIASISDVRVIDVPVPGVREGDQWAVRSFDDGSWIGGRVLPRPTRDATLLQSPDGARLFEGADADAMVRGAWTSAEPSCAARAARGDMQGGVIGGVVTGTGTSPYGSSRPSGPPPAQTPIVYVDRRGQRIADLGIEHRDVYAIRAGRLGERKWKKYRLSWAGFTDAVDSPELSLRLDGWVALNRQRKGIWSGMLGLGIGIAASSAVASAALSYEGAVNGNTGMSVSAPFVGGGIGAGSILALVAAVQRVKWGKRADRPERYYNLREYLSLDDLDVAVPPEDREATP